MTTHSWGESPIGKWQVSIVIIIFIIDIIIIIIIIVVVIVNTVIVVVAVCVIVIGTNSVINIVTSSLSSLLSSPYCHHVHPQLEIHNDAYSNWSSEAKFFRWSLKLYGTQSDPNSERPEDRAW